MKRQTKVLFVASLCLLLALSLIAFAACSGGVKATGLRVEPRTSTTLPYGARFDIDAIKVFVSYSDGTEEEIDSGKYVVDDGGFSPDVPGEYTFTVTYKADEKLKTTFKVTVLARVVSHIEAVSGRNYFEWGEEFSSEGLKLVVEYEGGYDPEEITTGFAVDSSNYKATEAGQYQITVTYEGQIATYTVTVDALSADRAQQMMKFENATIKIGGMTFVLPYDSASTEYTVPYAGSGEMTVELAANDALTVSGETSVQLGAGNRSVTLTIAITGTSYSKQFTFTASEEAVGALQIFGSDESSPVQQIPLSSESGNVTVTTFESGLTLKVDATSSYTITVDGQAVEPSVTLTPGNSYAIVCAFNNDLSAVTICQFTLTVEEKTMIEGMKLTLQYYYTGDSVGEYHDGAYYFTIEEVSYVSSNINVVDLSVSCLEVTLAEGYTENAQVEVVERMTGQNISDWQQLTSSMANSPLSVLGDNKFKVKVSCQGDEVTVNMVVTYKFAEDAKMDFFNGVTGIDYQDKLNFDAAASKVTFLNVDLSDYTSILEEKGLRNVDDLSAVEQIEKGVHEYYQCFYKKLNNNYEYSLWLMKKELSPAEIPVEQVEVNGQLQSPVLDSGKSYTMDVAADLASDTKLKFIFDDAKFDCYDQNMAKVAANAEYILDAAIPEQNFYFVPEGVEYSSAALAQRITVNVVMTTHIIEMSGVANWSKVVAEYEEKGYPYPYWNLILDSFNFSQLTVKVEEGYTYSLYDARTGKKASSFEEFVLDLDNYIYVVTEKDGKNAGYALLRIYGGKETNITTVSSNTYGYREGNWYFELGSSKQTNVTFNSNYVRKVTALDGTEYPNGVVPIEREHEYDYTEVILEYVNDQYTVRSHAYVMKRDSDLNRQDAPYKTVFNLMSSIKVNGKSTSYYGSPYFNLMLVEADPATFDFDNVQVTGSFKTSPNLGNPSSLYVFTAVADKANGCINFTVTLKSDGSEYFAGKIFVKETQPKSLSAVLAANK